MKVRGISVVLIGDTHPEMLSIAKYLQEKKIELSERDWD